MNHPNNRNGPGDPDDGSGNHPLNFFRDLKRRDAERRASVDPVALEEALLTLTRTLRANWSTHGGTHLRRFVWSLWNGLHPVNLYQVSGGWDEKINDAVILVFTGYFRGLVEEDRLRRLLKESGEMERWDAARANTPEPHAGNYPPLPVNLREHVAALEPLPKETW